MVLSRRRTELIAALLLLTTGCAMDQTRTITWDLRTTHAASAIGWTDGSPARSENGVDATVQLPGGHTLHASGVNLNLTASGGQITTLAVFYPRQTVDAGYTRARQVAAAWDLDTNALDTWYTAVVAARLQGKKDADESFNVGMAGAPLAPGGPTPFAHVISSFDPGQPFLLDLEFQWT